MAEYDFSAVVAAAKELRWQIHSHPELSNNESETTRRIADFLEAHNLRFHRFVGGLHGGYVKIDVGAAKTVCFRADIDALPIVENTGLKAASEVPGVMHACGHDMHTSIAAGLALALSQNKEKLRWNVVILFQPAEESNPRGGAKPLIEQGFLREESITGIYGLHVWPSYPVGTIGVRSGALMGSSDKMQIVVHGKGSHAAEPQNGIDAISIAADIVNGVVHKLRREIDPFDVCLATIGAIHSVGRYNVLCDQVVLEGTIRAASPEARTLYHARIRELASGIAACYGGTAEVAIADGYHVVLNEPVQTEQFIAFAKRHLGERHVDTALHPSLIGEDFSFFTEQVPSTYFFMGCNSPYPLHSDRFYPQEETLETAVRLMTGFFLDSL
ncbi:MAG: M20 family metallopeptidase [Pygmaiobacter sp.]